MSTSICIEGRVHEFFFAIHIYVQLFNVCIYFTIVSSEFIIYFVSFISISLFCGLRVSPVTNRSPLTPGSHRAEVRHGDTHRRGVCEPSSPLIGQRSQARPLIGGSYRSGAGAGMRAALVPGAERGRGEVRARDPSDTR